MNKPLLKRAMQQFLDQTYNSAEWQERLRRCRAIEHKNRPTRVTAGQEWGSSTVVIKYYEDDQRVAVVVFYRKSDGSVGASGKASCKGLLIDGVWHYSA